jgi:hypothetical protein
MGTALKGLRYEPLFPYFQHLAESDGAFVVMMSLTLVSHVPLAFLNLPAHSYPSLVSCIVYCFLCFSS